MYTHAVPVCVQYCYAYAKHTVSKSVAGAYMSGHRGALHSYCFKEEPATLASGQPAPESLPPCLLQLQRAPLLRSCPHQCSLCLATKKGEGERPSLWGPVADIPVVNSCVKAPANH